MKMTLSNRAQQFGATGIRQMIDACRKMNGINLAQGIADTPTPALFRRAAQKAIEDGLNMYSSQYGLPETCEAIANNLWTDHQLKYNPETEIVVTVGAGGAFFCAAFGLLNPGDEVIVFEPFYPYHLDVLTSLQVRPRFITLSPPDWRFDREALQQVISPATRAILINTPTNPSGKVFNRAELELIAECAAEHDLFVISDEIYKDFVFEPHEHISPATYKEIRRNTITIGGMSKTFSVTGWRIGYIACDRQWASGFAHVNERVFACAPTPLQKAVAVGLHNLDEDFFARLNREYTNKRSQLCEALLSVGLPPFVPQGTFYVMADISRLPGDSSLDKAFYFLKQTSVACTPGSTFYQNGGGEGLARFCFAKTDEDLSEACDRILKLN